MQNRVLSFLKKTVVGRSPSPDIDRDNLVRDEYIKKQLKDELASAIKRLQRNHINAEHEIDRNDEDALYICSILEGIFLHGYQDRKTGLKGVLQNTSIEEIQSISFWDLLEEITHSDVISQINNLAVTSRVGMCRAWIRLALNDCLIESYIDAVSRNKPNLKSFFNPNAFLMDTEALPIAIELLQGLMEFQFHLNYNSSKLDTWSVESLYLAGMVAGKHKKTEEDKDSSLRLQRTLEGHFTTEGRMKSASLVSSLTPSDRSRASSDVSMTTETSTPASRYSPLALTSDSTSLDQRSFLSSSSNEQPSNLVQTVSNRLSLTEDSWGGWSSAFENAPVNSIGTPSYELPSNEPRGTASSVAPAQSDGRLESSDLNIQPSFDSLLQRYGAPKPLHSKMAEQLEINIQDPTIFPHFPNTEIPLSPSEDENVQQMNFEVVPLSSSLNTRHTDERTQFLLDHITVIGVERGLDKQSFQCIGCGRSIGLIYGLYKVCYYDGGYYCLECHDDEEHMIPAKIIHNWDFKPYNVAKLTKLFLMKIEEEPLFHIDEINPTLYNAVPVLNEVKMLRIQLQNLKGYILTCKNDVAEDFRKRLWPREYLCDDVHQYSSLDLVQVHTGQLANHLKKVIGQFSKHVFKCSLCSQKGFICEICNSQKIIYPFEILTTIQCHRCLSLYHRKCKNDRRCAKCLRLQFRKKKEEKAIDWPNNHSSFNAQHCQDPNETNNK